MTASPEGKARIDLLTILGLLPGPEATRRDMLAVFTWPGHGERAEARLI